MVRSPGSTPRGLLPRVCSSGYTPRGLLHRVRSLGSTLRDPLPGIHSPGSAPRGLLKKVLPPICWKGMLIHRTCIGETSLVLTHFCANWGPSIFQLLSTANAVTTVQCPHSQQGQLHINTFCIISQLKMRSDHHLLIWNGSHGYRR